MRKVILSLAAAGAALTAAAPASAQFFPQPQPYGNAYGINNYGQVRALQARLDNLQRQIERLDRRNVIRERDAKRLREQSRNIERRLRSAARSGGLSPWEANDIQTRVMRLEQTVHYTAMARNGAWGQGNRGYYDRDDRDDRDDGHDRGHRRDRDDRGDRDWDD